jgi:hypothetical protein
MSLSASLFGVEEALQGGCWFAGPYGLVRVVAVGVGWSDVQAEFVGLRVVGMIQMPFLTSQNHTAASCAARKACVDESFDFGAFELVAPSVASAACGAVGGQQVRRLPSRRSAHLMTGSQRISAQTTTGSLR